MKVFLYLQSFQKLLANIKRKPSLLQKLTETFTPTSQQIWVLFEFMSVENNYVWIVCLQSLQNVQCLFKNSLGMNDKVFCLLKMLRCEENSY